MKLIAALIITVFMLIKLPFTGLCQQITPADSLTGQASIPTENSKALHITTLTYGGTGVLFTSVNNQFTVMNGGRGSATFNNRLTFGGGGWGMAKGVEVTNIQEDSYSFIKMGYGGLEIGYIVLPGEKLNIGTHLMTACGALFKETIPDDGEDVMKIFPVVEPSVFAQVSLGKIFRLDIGLSYRFVRGSNFPEVSDHDLSGFSCYLAFLAGACKCSN